MRDRSKKRTLRAALTVATVFLMVTMMVGWALASLPREDFDTGVPGDWQTFTRWPWGSYYPFQWKGDSGSAWVTDAYDYAPETKYEYGGEGWLVSPVFHVDSGDQLTIRHQQTVRPGYTGDGFSEIWIILSDDYAPETYTEGLPPHIKYDLHLEGTPATFLASFDATEFTREDDFSLSAFEDEDVRLIFALRRLDSNYYVTFTGDQFNTWSLDYAVVSQDQEVVVDPPATDDEFDGDVSYYASNSGCNVAAGLPFLALFLPLALLLKK